VHYESAEAIDSIGIEGAIRRALEGALATLDTPHTSTQVFLDGRLKAPEQFAQETIIGGDGKVPIISLASVIAKVSRDRIMCDFGAQYPAYGFSKHKGYGTALHISAIKKEGLSPLHRKSFLSRIAPSA
jgi:ribonuclease HII